MPIEMRTLIFSPDEIAEAIADHVERGGESLPRGRVVHCEIGAGSGVSMVVKLVPPDRAQVRTITLDAEALGAALVAFCLSRAIPLPRGGSRSLQVMGEMIALSLAIDELRAPLPAFA